MTRAVAVLRPEPGNAATCVRLRQAGLVAVPLPLFAVVPLAWTVPDAADHDALLLASAHAVRQAGAALAGLRTLPTYAVGAATAAAAREAGLAVCWTGASDGAAMLDAAMAAGVRHGLHLGGRDRRITNGGPVSRIETLYASEAVEVPPARRAALRGTVVLIHSPRAARRLVEVAAEPPYAVVAISAAAAASLDARWRIAVADRPDDPAMIRAARALTD